MGVDQRALLLAVPLAAAAASALARPSASSAPAVKAGVVGRLGDPGRMLVDAAEPFDEQRAGQPRRLPAAGRRMLADPVAGDVEPGRDPDPFVAHA